MMILLLCILLHSVSSLNIRIDGDNGNDSIECLTEQPQSSCQSLKYVADTINKTGNLTIEIISPTLSLQGSVVFTDINGLTINGQGTSISCSNGSILYSNSGIVFDTCSNVKLISFTIEHCGLLHKKEKYHGRQSIFFISCKNFQVLKVNFSDNNGYGLVLYDSISSANVTQNTFANNGIKHTDLLKAEESNATGGGLHIFQYNPYNSPYNTIIIAGNQFINNSATTIGGALHIKLNHCTNFFYIAASNFIGNTAGTAGGAIGFIVHKTRCNYNSTIPFGFRVTLISCNITNNKAKFGGGVAIQIVHYESVIDGTKLNQFSIEFCHFTGNKAMVSSAVDINGRSQKIDRCLETVVYFNDCYFTGNMAGIDNNQLKVKGKLFKATLYATDAYVYCFTNILFVNNIGTALYAVNARVHISHGAIIRFLNNIGDQGGAIFLADESAIDFSRHKASPLINFSNNTALLGGAIYIQSLEV